MKQLAALLFVLLAVGCAIPQTSPASFEESGLFAAATQTSVASYYNATAQAADATRAAQIAQATATAAAFYAGATATSQAAAQQTAVAATATTAWLTTRENREAVAFQAGINATATIYAHQANATATRMKQQAELDAKRARRSDLWGWLGMAAILLLIVGLLWVLRAQADAIRMRSEVRTDSRGNLIAFLTPDGWQLASPRLLPPVIENPPQPTRPGRTVLEVRQHASNTILYGKVELEEDTWRAVFRKAAENDGQFSRDRVAPGLIPNYTAVWPDIYADLERLGLVKDNRLTREGFQLAGSPAPVGYPGVN